MKCPTCGAFPVVRCAETVSGPGGGEVQCLKAEHKHGDHMFLGHPQWEPESPYHAAYRHAGHVLTRAKTHGLKGPGAEQTFIDALDRLVREVQKEISHGR